MKLFRRGKELLTIFPEVRPVLRLAPMFMLTGVLAAGGCASPGPPRAPSLRLPEPVADLSARRTGDSVELHFTAPWRSTDKLPLRATTLKGVLCRAVDHQPCVAVAGFSSKAAIAIAGPNGGHNLVTYRDPLPAGLNTGPRRLLIYRVEFFNDAGRSAGMSVAAYTATGPAPPPVANLRAEGSRFGIVLRWRSDLRTDATVLLQRESLASGAKPASRRAPSAAVAQSASGGVHRPATSKPGWAEKNTAAKVVWFDTNTAGSGACSTALPSPASELSQALDMTAVPDVAYRYTAVRRAMVVLGGRSIELRSAASAPVEFTLHEIYPPPAPTGLIAAGYFTTAGSATDAASGFFVDLIWQPVNDAGLIAGLAGYNVYRTTLSGGEGAGNNGGAPGENRLRLNSTPAGLPAFHDSTANPANAYRYFVTAVDTRGNESSAATVDLQASQDSPTH